MLTLQIARNPEESTLPFLVRIPIGDGIVLRVKDTWPRTSKIYCHPHGLPWPDDPEIVEELPLRSCVKRGAAIDIEVDRTRESRSQFVFARARGREVIFWQSRRTSKTARPDVKLPTARASGLAELEIVVDTRERYAWEFAAEQATTVKRALPVGDYGVEVDGELVAAVERKSLEDLAGSLLQGTLFEQQAALAKLSHGVVLVEDRYSSVFKLTHVRPSVIADMLGEAAARYPTVPVIFAETRSLAEQWAFRFFGAVLRERAMGEELDRRLEAGEL